MNKQNDSPQGRAAANLELAGKLFSLAALLLPVFGVMARALALAFSGLAPISIAAEATLSQAALAGVIPAIFVSLTTLLAVSYPKVMGPFPFGVPAEETENEEDAEGLVDRFFSWPWLVRILIDLQA